MMWIFTRRCRSGHGQISGPTELEVVASGRSTAHQTKPGPNMGGLCLDRSAVHPLIGLESSGFLAGCQNGGTLHAAASTIEPLTTCFHSLLGAVSIVCLIPNAMQQPKFLRLRRCISQKNAHLSNENAV